MLLHLTATLTAVGLAGVTVGAHADIIRFTPALLLEQIFTDNVRGSATDRDADGVTSVGLRVDGLIETSRIDAAAQVRLYYNEFWGADEFDNFNGTGNVGGRLTILHNRLFIDGAATRQEVFLTPESTTGSGLATGSGTTKQTDYSVGPFLQTELLTLADLAVRATYTQVLFDEPLAGPLLTPLDDLTAKSVAARITTGERHGMFELIGTGEHLETDLGFRLQNGVGHVLLHLTPSFTAIGRYGYETIEDPSIPEIRGPRWSFGGRYSFSEDSAVQVEYGHRFDSTSWYGEIDLRLSPRVVFNAQYTDTIAPAQLSTLRPLDDLFDDGGNLSLQSTPSPVVPSPLLIGQIVRDKNLSTSTVYTRGLATFSITGRHAERMIPALATNDKLYAVDLEWREVMSRSLTGLASVGFFDNYEPPVGTEAVMQANAEVGFVYIYTPEITFTGSYLWSVTMREIEANSQENVVRVGMVHAF